MHSPVFLFSQERIAARVAAVTQTKLSQVPWIVKRKGHRCLCFSTPAVQEKRSLVLSDNIDSCAKSWPDKEMCVFLRCVSFGFDIHSSLLSLFSLVSPTHQVEPLVMLRYEPGDLGPNATTSNTHTEAFGLPRCPNALPVDAGGQDNSSSYTMRRSRGRDRTVFGARGAETRTAP